MLSVFVFIITNRRILTIINNISLALFINTPNVIKFGKDSNVVIFLLAFAKTRGGGFSVRDNNNIT